MKKMYPLFLDLSACRCLVVGAGRVGCRKVDGLLHGGATNVLVLDTGLPFLNQEWGKTIRDGIEKGFVSFRQRAFFPEDIDGCFLVFATTSDPQCNAAVIAACRERGILCNSADDPHEGNCMVPARVDAGGICLALSTGGESPALAAHLRKELEVWIGDKYNVLCQLLGRLRPLILARGHDPDQNADLFRRVVHSSLAESLSQHDYAQSEMILREILPVDLHPHIMELLHESA